MRRSHLFQTAVFLFIITVFVTVCATPAVAQRTAYREITVTALADRELMENDAEGTEREIKDIIAFAADVFKQEFGVTLKLRAVKPWEFPYGKTKLDANDALADANVQARGNKDSDITLGFTKKKLMLEYKKLGGYAFMFGNAAVTHFDESIALHEIGHLFGAHHSQDPLSIMYEGYTDSENFDRTNKAIIQKTMEKKFSMPSAP